MLQPWQDAVVTKIIQETPNTKRFFLALTSGQVFDFIPGQFVTFDLPIHEQKIKDGEAIPLHLPQAITMNSNWSLYF